MATFLQLCQTTRRECGIQGNGPTTVVGQTGLLQKVVGWVADADEYIQSLHHDWDFLWTAFSTATVAGTDLLTKPADLGAWDRESFGLNRGLATGRPLSVIDYKVWRQMMWLKNNAAPGSITIRPDGHLLLGAPADGVYTVSADYWKIPTRLVADNDVSNIPTSYDRVIVCRAKMFYAEDQEFPELYKAAEKEFTEWLTVLRGNQLPGQQWRMQSEAPQLAVRPA